MNAKRFYESGGDTLAVRADAPETVVGGGVESTIHVMDRVRGPDILKRVQDGVVVEVNYGGTPSQLFVKWDDDSSSIARTADMVRISGGALDTVSSFKPGMRVVDRETFRRGVIEGVGAPGYVRVRWGDGEVVEFSVARLMLYDDVKRKVLWALGAALAGVAVGALLWPGHRVIGALIGAKVGLGGYAVATGRRKEGAVLLATAAGGFLLARTWQRHPVVGYLLGSAGGSAAGRAGIGIAEGMARG